MTSEVFKSFDVFGKSLPTFILKGRKEMKTFLGGFVSILVFLVILMYATLKFTHLALKHNP